MSGDEQLSSRKSRSLTFGTAKGGKEYRRPVPAFERIFGATIFCGGFHRADGHVPLTALGSTPSEMRRSGMTGTQLQN